MRADDNMRFMFMFPISIYGLCSYLMSPSFRVLRIARFIDVYLFIRKGEISVGAIVFLEVVLITEYEDVSIIKMRCSFKDV